MKRLFCYSLCFLYCFIMLYSCSNDNEAIIEPQIDIIGHYDYFLKGMDFANNAGEENLSFNSNVDWNITVANTANGEKWCTVTPNNGKSGKNVVRIQVDENNSVDDRNVSLTLRAGEVTKTIQVTQKQKDALTLTTDKFEVKKEGGMISVEVKSNINFEIIIPERCKNWIQQSAKSRGMITNKLSFLISASEEYDKREGEIIFKSGNLSETVYVYQAGEGVLLLTKNEYLVSNKGETIKVEIKSNFDFNVKMPDVDWVKETVKNRGMSSHTLYFDISSNNSEGRETEIVFSDKNSDIHEILKIVQDPADIINISKIELDESYKEVYVSESFKLMATIHPDNATDKNINWSSSNENIAFVDKDGLVTAISEGEAYITANSDNVKDSCLVKVKPIKVYDNSILSEVHIFSEGMLNDILTDDEKKTVLKLKITGHINSEDLKIIRERLIILEDLDISETNLSLLPDDSFKNMAQLKKIKLPMNLNTIGRYAFQNCSALEKISIPDNVETIYEGAFSICISLKQISFTPKSKLKELIGTINSTDGIFYRCNSLESITIPESVDIIGENCFSNCTSLVTVILPQEISNIKDCAFMNCSSLSSINLPNRLTSINRYTFKDCISLTNIKLPINLEQIYDSAFDNCSSLQLIQIPETVWYIGQFAFGNCISLQQINLPEAMRGLEWYAFENCKSLNSIVIPSKIKSINRSFSGCNSLKKITCLAEVPPVVNQFSFSMISNECELWVLSEYLERYKNNVDWKNIFVDKIFPIQ